MQIINIVTYFPLVFFNLGTDGKENCNFKIHYDLIKWLLTFLCYSNATTHSFVDKLLATVFLVMLSYILKSSRTMTDFSASVKVQLWEAR